MSGRKSSTICVAVCGLTSSSYPGLSGQGAGKSYLCNRFVRPKKDDLRLNHPSVLNHSEFGTNVINNTHFLYWGEKVVGLEDGQDVTFQILEHTEFVDDSSLKPFSFTKPYYKRCTQLKLQSGGKVTYIEPDQLSLPEQYTDVGKFPDKFLVDGFILCVDVSLDFEKPGNPQREIFDKLLHNIISTKKPVVVACTKFDRALDHSVAAVNDMVLKAKRQVPVIEVSALKGVNVDLCFLVLSHLVDTKKPRTRVTPYSDAKQHLDDRIKKNEISFQYLLDNKLADFSMSVAAASTMLQNEVEFQLLRELCGSERIHKLVRAKLTYLKKEAVGKKLAHTLEQLPAVLDTLLPKLPLEANVDSCVRSLKEREKSVECLVDLENWREDAEYLKKTTIVVPLSLFSEEQGREILQKHIDKVLTSARADVACERIQKALESSTGLIPGANMYDVFNELSVSEEVSRVPEERLMKLYQDHMVHVEQECVSDVKELLLEHSDLFDQLDAADVLGRVDQELASCDRYQRLDKRPDLRKSTVIKHIANLQWPDKGPYARSHLLEVLQSETPTKDSLVPPSHPISSDNLKWVLAPDDQAFNLAILARTETNALTLRSDFMNHLSGQGTCTVNDRRYQLEMMLFPGPPRSLTSKDFVPQGAVAVVTSMECLDWLEDLLNKLWVPGGNAKPQYRGMPLVILAVDECIEEDNTNNTNGSNGDSELWKRAKLLAHRVQSVCITEHLPIVPKRLVVTSVIHTLLVSLIDSVKQCDKFLNSDLSLEPEGLNITMFSLTGDPYPNLHMLSPWLDHQLVWFSEKDSCLFLRAAIDKQHRTCSISFHSALNIKDLKASIRLGFILVYSAERPASLAIIRSLLAKLPKIPILLVAMATEGSRGSQLLEEGHGLAEQWKASFVSSSEPSWSIEQISEFFSKCWFSRFSSWNAQDVPEEVKQRLRRRKPLALPDRPLPSHPSSLREPVTSSSLSNRLSTPDFTEHPPSHLFLHSVGSLPRSPSRSKYTYTLQSPTAFHGDATYSSPQELGIGVQQKKAATLERKKKGTSDNNSSRVPVPLPLQLEDENSEYARVADHVKMSHQLMGSLKRKSPTFAPPPPPLGTVSTPPPINGQLREEEGEDGESKTYDQPHKRTTPLSPKDRGYDHLAKTNYDHLAPIEYPSSDTEPTETYATIEDNRKMLKQQEVVPLCTYATIEGNKKVLHQQETPPLCTYATIEGNKKVLHQQETPPLCTYATINESRKMPNVPVPRRENHLAYKSAAVQRRQASVDNPKQNGEGNQLYSVINKPQRQRSAEDVLQNVPRVVTSANPDHLPKKPMRRYTPEAASEDMYTLPDRSKNQREVTHSHVDEPKKDFSSNGPPDRQRKAEARRQRSAEDVVQNVPRVVTSANPDHLPKKPMRRYTPEAASEDLYTLPDRSKNQREATHSHVDELKKDFSSNGPPDRQRKAEARRQRSAEDVLQNVPRVVTSANPDHLPKKPMQRYTPEAASEDMYTLPDRSKNQREPTHSHVDEPNKDFSSNSLPDRRRKAEAPDFNSLPNRSKRAVNPPPPVAPKPKFDRAKRSPTPNASVSSRSESPDTIPKPNFIKQLLTSPKSRRKKEQQQQKQQQERSKPMQRYSPEDASEDLYTLPDKPKDTRQGRLAVEAANRAFNFPRDDVMLRDRVWSDGARGRIRGRDNVGLGERVGSLDDNRYVGAESRQYGGLSSGDELDEEEAEENVQMPALPQRNYSLSELGLEAEPPPLPSRNYSWSDVEDNDDELFQSDDDLDEPPAKISASDHLAIYASIQQYKRSSTGGMEDIYNVVDRMAHGEKSQQEVTSQESEAASSVYDTLQNVIRSMPAKSSYSTPISGEKEAKREEPKKERREDEVQERSSAAASPVPAAPFTSREVKLIKQQQKLLEKLEKKANKEAERRRKQEAKRRRREEDEQRKREGRKKVKRPKGQKQPERQRYFGSPLEMVAGDDGVPSFVRQCIGIIEKKALKAEGLYRVSGKKEDCLALQEKVDEDFNLDVASLGYYENVISSTLKAFFKLLPNPLISDEVASKILAVNSLPVEAQQAKVHEILTTNMPLPNLKTLRTLVTHLYHVQEYEEFNKMTASNLAIVFWPTLMRPPLLDLADPSKQLGWQMAMTQIIEHPEFVPDL